MYPNEGFFLIGRYQCQECNKIIVGEPDPNQQSRMDCFCGGMTVFKSVAQMPLGSSEPFREKELTRGFKETR